MAKPRRYKFLCIALLVVFKKNINYMYRLNFFVICRNAQYLKAKAMSRSRRRQKAKLAEKDSQESTTENAEKGTSER